MVHSKYRTSWCSAALYLLLPCLQIIAQTAKFVRASGANGFQVEVKLRVQQAGNPKFDFLSTQDRLYPYYRWVLLSPALAVELLLIKRLLCTNHAKNACRGGLEHSSDSTLWVCVASLPHSCTVVD